MTNNQPRQRDEKLVKTQISYGKHRVLSNIIIASSYTGIMQITNMALFSHDTILLYKWAHLFVDVYGRYFYIHDGIWFLTGTSLTYTCIMLPYVEEVSLTLAFITAPGIFTRTAWTLAS